MLGVDHKVAVEAAHKIKILKFSKFGSTHRGQDGRVGVLDGTACKEAANDRLQYQRATIGEMRALMA